MYSPIGYLQSDPVGVSVDEDGRPQFCIIYIVLRHQKRHLISRHCIIQLFLLHFPKGFAQHSERNKFSTRPDRRH